ncbi:MAG: hypothetical protein COB23_07165 [Methylophaga sp.]|nr:MAG: hypothetical protein COB23_07165 [Methylophaga sp.]
METELTKRLSKEDWGWFKNNPGRVLRVRRLLDGEDPYIGHGQYRPYVIILKMKHSDYLVRKGISDIEHGIKTDEGEDIVTGFNPVDCCEVDACIVWQLLDTMESEDDGVIFFEDEHYWLTGVVAPMDRKDK